MEQEIQLRSVLGNLAEKSGDFFVPRNIARVDGGVGPELGHKLLHVFFQAFALVVENQFCASVVPGLGNRPGNAAFVCHAKNNARLVGKYPVTHSREQSLPSQALSRSKRLPDF